LMCLRFRSQGVGSKTQMATNTRLRPHSRQRSQRLNQVGQRSRPSTSRLNYHRSRSMCLWLSQVAKYSRPFLRCARPAPFRSLRWKRPWPRLSTRSPSRSSGCFCAACPSQAMQRESNPVSPRFQPCGCNLPSMRPSAVAKSLSRGSMETLRGCKSSYKLSNREPR
jgi:hypothetical protein